MHAAASLEALQAAFARHLLDEPSDFRGAVAEGGRIGVERRLAIYHNAYRARLVDALKDSYGHTLVYLGDDNFEAAARGYLAENPSIHPNLRWFGAAFADWLASAAPGDPDIGELAALDWALRRAFDGADAPVLSLAELAALPPETWARVGLRWHPTCQRLQLAHNTLAIWSALDRDEAPPTAERLETPTELLVWRLGLQPHFRSLAPLEALAIDALREGTSFAATCEQLAAAFPEVETAPQAGALLRRWVEDGLVSGLDAAH